jgi:hypothetical protein
MFYPAQTLPQQTLQPVRSTRKKKARALVITSRYEEILQ